MEVNLDTIDSNLAGLRKRESVDKFKDLTPEGDDTLSSRLIPKICTII